MDSVDVDSSGLEDGFIVDLEELDSFDPIISFTTVMIECKWIQNLRMRSNFVQMLPSPQ